MGTWGPEILGNDTSFDVHATLLEAYDAGVDVGTLANTIKKRFATELSLPLARDDVLFALALGLWEIGALGSELRREVAALVASGSNLAAWKEAQAKPETVQARARVLATFIEKIGTPRKVPRRRKPPPLTLETPFAPGVCLSFQYPDKAFGGVVVVESSFTKNRGRMALSSTDMAQRTKPTMPDFRKARLLGFDWSAPFDEKHRSRYAATNGKVATIGVKGLCYERAAARMSFLDRCAGFFEVAGYLSPFGRMLLRTSGFGAKIQTATTTEDLRRHLADEQHHDLENAVREKARRSPPLGKLPAMLKR